uniref:Secreted protein n=1 Tax=Lotus japonicus TaxID=34305 RepID=I3SSL6_LOTJA|nr:unknown [Lotus japonicus]
MFEARLCFLFLAMLFGCWFHLQHHVQCFCSSQFFLLKQILLFCCHDLKMKPHQYLRTAGWVTLLSPHHLVYFPSASHDYSEVTLKIDGAASPKVNDFEEQCGVH